MTLDDFNRLCQREWSRNLGDVTEIRLHEDSASALAVDALMLPDAWNTLMHHIPVDELPAIRGGCITRLQNPVTRSDVKIVITDGPESALVSYGQVREPETVPV